MKEMVGGCCVCSDERGWDENPLVYCDGPSCNVAVHQACYGIVAVPSGPWFCRKCESSERSGRVRCELCPSRDGAFKKTDNGNWAHVVCALYIPEVRFDNVSTMEPILISLIPQERYNKICYICEERSDKKDVRAGTGACMQCNKPGCKQFFHVTCAQMLGLLCEEAGNMMDNVKYCGYCEYHYGKLKKSSNLKIIPPFKPIPSGNSTESPSSSPEKNGTKGTSVAGNHSNSGSADGVTATSLPPALSIIGESVTKTMSSSKSSKKSGHGRASSVSSASSNGSTNNSNNNSGSASMPRIQIQPSNLFTSSTGFSSYSTTVNANPNGSSAGPQKSRSKSRSPSLDEVILKGGKGSGVGRKAHSFSGSSGRTIEEEPSTPSTPKEGELTRSKLSSINEQPNPAPPTSFTPATLSSKLKDLAAVSATVSMKEVISPPVERVPNSKFERNGSTSLGSGETFTSTGSTGTGTTSRIDKPPPEIVPHVTLTPIPMKPADEPSKADRSSKSPASFSSGFPRTAEPMETEMATISLEKAPSPGKRIRGREEENRSKGPAGKRGRRGNSVTNFGRRETGLANGNAVMAVEDNVDGGAKIDEEVGQGATNNTTGRSGRHTVPSSRKGSAVSSVAPTPVPSVQNSPSMSRKASYDEAPPLTMSQLKAQMAASASPEKSASLAPHMFGNALNPASSMAQRMVDTLSQEMETIGGSAETQQEAVIATTAPLVGIPFPGKSGLQGSSLGSKVNGLSTHLAPTTLAKPQPQTLEELLERQWEQGSQFLMEQAQHLDISQLLSCLNQLKADNKALEDHVASLRQRKEQLTAINARLSIPLGSTNTLGLGLGFTSNRQETPPMPSIAPTKMSPASISSHAQAAQLHAQQQQEVGLQGRYAQAYKYSYDPGAHAYQQQHHRNSSGSAVTSQQQQQLYSYAGQGAPPGQGHHLQAPRESR